MSENQQTRMSNEAAIQGIPHSRFGLLSEPPTLILKLDAALERYRTVASAWCRRRRWQSRVGFVEDTPRRDNLPINGCLYVRTNAGRTKWNIISFDAGK